MEGETMIHLKNGDGIQWPEGKRIAVLLTFDFDAELLRYSVIGKKNIGFADISRGQYGVKEGLQRCLNMLQRNGLPATFFIPGQIIEKYPEACKAIAVGNYEIAYHGYEHNNTIGLTQEQETENLEKSEKLIETLCGKKPVGARGPLDALQDFSLDQFAERGYLYDSTLKDCDWAYVLDNGLVELPTDVAVDDFSYFYFSYADEAPINCSYLPENVLEIWQDAYDELAAEGDKIMVIKLHPQLIGRVSRINMLEKFILYMQQRGAWLADCRTVAQYVKDHGMKKGAEVK